MKTIRRYPSSQHPDVHGEVFYDDETDPQVTYIHYRDFIKPGLRRAITAVIAIDQATGQTSIVDGDQASIDEIRRNAEIGFLKRATSNFRTIH